MGKNAVKGHLDYTLLLSVVLLIAIGVTMVYSSSAIYAQERFHDTHYFLKREIFYLIVGVVAMLTALGIPIGIYKKYIYFFILSAIVFLALVFVPGIGSSAGAASRWIRVGGIGFQPSEFAKVVLVIFLAYILSKKREKIKSFIFGYVPTIAISGILIAMVLAGRDLGNAALMGGVLFFLLFMAGTRYPYLIATVLLSVPVFYMQIISHEYRMRRILAFLDPWEHRSDAGFQIIQSYVAFNKGGLIGQGLGEGKQKLFYLPAAHTDFIFSVIGEELGWIGVITILSIFFALVSRAFIIGWRAKDSFTTYLALGIGSLIGMQVVLNVGVVLGLLPTKGLTLPFISYGGTSLVISLFMVGVLLNISYKLSREKI